MTIQSLLKRSHSKLPKIAEYSQGVLDGRIVTNELVHLAVERHVRDLREGADRGLSWDEAAAQKVVRFFERVLVLVEGEGKRPFLLEPWQQFVLGNLFGWKGPDGYRRFRTAYIEIGKGSGKSPMAAGIGLYGLIGDKESAAEVYLAATKKEQAKIVFRDADNMVEASPYLAARIQRSSNTLSVLSTHSFLKAISSDTRGIDGPRPHIIIVDEVHEAPNAILIDKLRAGTKGRRQALQIEITNSGCDPHSVCWNHHEYSEKILRGVLDNDTWFGFVCGLDPCAKCKAEGKSQPSDDCEQCDKWTDERHWPKANPNLGVSIHHKYLREQVTEALGMPSKENLVKRLNFCIWTERGARWMSLEKWDACKSIYNAADLVGERACGGLDLASIKDLAAFVLHFPEARKVLAFFWVPEKNVQARVKEDRVPYDVWIRQGLIKATPGDVIDYDLIRQDIIALGEMFQIEEIGFDPWNATQLSTQLENHGFKMVKVPQNAAVLTEPMRDVEKLVLGQQIQHDGNPVLRWCISNIVAVETPDSIRPDKERSIERIDGGTALITARSRSMVHVEEETGSVYDQGAGIFSVSAKFN
jgi:phage terminase large subunit-like protein